ncbi:MAG: hypothetical protein U0838_02425 [Chloroflexota bacterium]
MNDRGRVDVPENGMRSEPIAFGLSTVQLLLCGAAVLAAAAVNAAPLWLPAKLALIGAVAGPIVLAAVLAISGDPAYRWLGRALRYARGPKVWQAELLRTAEGEARAGDERHASAGEARHKPEIRDSGDDAPATAAARAADTALDPFDTQTESRDPRGGNAPSVQELRSMGDQIVSLRVVRDGPEPAPQGPDPAEVQPDRPAVVPHLLPGLRIVALLSFAGGVGKTTLAVEAATLVAAHARYRTMDGDEHPLRVLLLDASRVTSGAAGIRLGLSGEALSRAANPRGGTTPAPSRNLAVATRAGAWTSSRRRPTRSPPAGSRSPRPSATRVQADRVDDLVEGAREAGYQLLVVDMGSHLEDGHRHPPTGRTSCWASSGRRSSRCPTRPPPLHAPPRPRGRPQARHRGEPGARRRRRPRPRPREPALPSSPRSRPTRP